MNSKPSRSASGRIDLLRVNLSKAACRKLRDLGGRRRWAAQMVECNGDSQDTNAWRATRCLIAMSFTATACKLADIDGDRTHLDLSLCRDGEVVGEKKPNPTIQTRQLGFYLATAGSLP